MRAPLAAVAAVFAAGIGLAWWLAPAAWALALASGTVAWAGWRARKRPAAANLCLLALALLAGMGRAVVDARLPADSVVRLMGPEPRPVACEGVLVQDDSWYPPGGGRGQRKGWLEIRRVRRGDRWAPASGRVQIRLPSRAGPVRVGDALRLHGLLRRYQVPKAGSVPGTKGRFGARYRFDERRWLWARGTCGVLSVSEPEALALLPDPPGLRLGYLRWVAEWRWRLQEAGRALLGPMEAGFLEAFLLGEGRGISADVKEDFRRTGTIHILVVSGFQVGLIGAITLTALSFFRLPRGARYLLAGLALFLYCALTGAAPPTLRATVMGLAFCLGRYQGREVSPLNLLGAAALVILAPDPRALADVGFQLSFAAVIGILLAAGWTAPKSVPGTEPPFGTWYRGLRYRFLVQPVVASLGAWAAVTPLVAWHMRMLSWSAPAVNLLMVPLGSLLVAEGLLLYAVGSVWPAGAAPFAAGFTLLARAATALAASAAGLPGGSFRW